MIYFIVLVIFNGLTVRVSFRWKIKRKNCKFETKPKSMTQKYFFAKTLFFTSNVQIVTVINLVCLVLHKFLLEKECPPTLVYIAVDFAKLCTFTQTALNTMQYSPKYVDNEHTKNLFVLILAIFNLFNLFTKCISLLVRGSLKLLSFTEVQYFSVFV